MAKMAVLNIVDVSNLAHRYGHFGRTYCYGSELIEGIYQPVSVPSGVVNGILGYVSKIRQGYLPDSDYDNYFIFCFDSKTKLKKKMLFEEYKAGRKYDAKAKIHEQLDYLERVLETYGYATKRVDGYEADDIAYSVWKSCELDFDMIFLHTTDQDWAFMIDDRTIMLRGSESDLAKGKTVLVTKDNYPQAFGIQYNTMLLNKVLFGDASDNIKGIGRAWGSLIVDSIPSDLSFGDMGHVTNVRRVLLDAGQKDPNFPLNDAINVLDLATPEDIDVSDIIPDVLQRSPKAVPSSYFDSVKPQNRDDVHRDMFFDFVEACRQWR